MIKVVVDDIGFVKDAKTGYYLSSTPVGDRRVRLHVYVWEKHFGKVPVGLVVHHVNKDKDNNTIENLCLMTNNEHCKFHSNSEECKTKSRETIKNITLPAAVVWHKSDVGKARHKEWYAANPTLKLTPVKRNCDQCGKEYVAGQGYSSRFCSGRCKTKNRKLSGVDDVEVACVVCGKTFRKNKYTKQKCCSEGCGRKSGVNTRADNRDSALREARCV